MKDGESKNEGTSDARLTLQAPFVGSTVPPKSSASPAALRVEFINNFIQSRPLLFVNKKRMD